MDVPAHQDSRVSRVLRDLRALKVNEAVRERLGLKAPADLKAPRENEGQVDCQE